MFFKQRVPYKRVFIISLSIIIILLLNCSITIHSYASSWVSQDSEIYQGDQDKGELLQVLEDFRNETIEEAESILADLFGPLFVALGDGLYMMTGPVGFDLNAIIYGRVGGSAYMTDNISLFTYELTNGNIFGVISMALYSVIRVLVFVLIVCAFLYRLVAFLYTSGGAKEREALKQGVMTFIIMLLTLILAPKVLDLCLYIRDLFLYQIMIGGTELLGDAITSTGAFIGDGKGEMITEFFGANGSYSLLKLYRDVSDGSLINSMMYLGVVLLQIYFGAVYISAAAAMVVLVVFLPVACLYEFFDKGFLGGWIKEILGILFIPIIDSVLLYIPLMVGVFGLSASTGTVALGYALVQVLLCGSIIPARSYVRRRLGLGGSQAMELAGIGSIFGAMSLVKVLGRGIGNILQKSKETTAAANNDEDVAETYMEQAKAIDFESEDQEKHGASIINDSINDKSTGSDSFIDPMSESELEGMTMEERAFARAENLDRGIEAMDQRKTQLDEDTRSEEARVTAIGEQIAAIDEDTASLKAERTNLDMSNEGEKMLARETDKKISENDVDRKTLVSEQSSLRRSASDKREESQKLSRSIRHANGVLVSMRTSSRLNGRGGGTSQPGGINLDKYANIDNFELPAFKNISLQKKAELHRERASILRRQMGNEIAGMAAGSIIGSTVGFGASMFATPPTKLIATGAVGGLGAAAGVAISGVAKQSNSNSRSVASALPNNYNTSQNEMKMGISKEGEISDISSGRHILNNSQDNKSSWRQEHSASTFGSYYDSSRYQVPVKDQISPTGEQVYVDQPPVEENRSKNDFYDYVWNETLSDQNSHKYMDEQTRRALRDAASVAREYIKGVSEDYRYDPDKKDDENEIILNNALDAFSSTLGNTVINTDIFSSFKNTEYEVDANDFEDYITEKLSDSARVQLEMYLRAKNLLL